ncbi:MAG TPA: class I SAM-dependent methyltransferase [Abditibacterium sp.]|jgi:hypothetical protein
MTTQIDSSTLQQIEKSRLSVQIALDAQKTPQERNKCGQYATPPALAVEVARCVRVMMPESCPPLAFCEPALGTGAFYSAFLSVFPAECIQRATGVEIDPNFATFAQDLWSASGLEVLEGDFTTLLRQGHLPKPANVVLTNPPYSRHHHLTPTQKQQLQAEAARLTGIKVNGLAGLYVYFMLIASAWMQDDGVAAWLLPSEFMDVNFGAAIKSYLLRHAADVWIHRFDPCDVQFADALVSSAIVIFRKAEHRPGATIRMSYGGSLQQPQSSQDVPLEKLSKARKWTSFPQRHPILEDLQEDKESTLGNFFDIKRGIATGANKVFIMPRAEAERRKFPASFLRPVLPSPRHLRDTVIETETDGYPQLAQPLCVIDCDLSPQALQTEHRQLWDYLEETASKGFEGRYILMNRRLWYKQETRLPAPFLCTYMGRDKGENKPFRFLWNRSQATATNLYLLLYPKGQLAELLKEQPALEATVYEALNQLGDEISAQGRFYGGGLHKIEPNELRRVPARRLLDLMPQLDKLSQLSLEF